jgi:hypothetical protein
MIVASGIMSDMCFLSISRCSPGMSQGSEIRSGVRLSEKGLENAQHMLVTLTLTSFHQSRVLRHPWVQNNARGAHRGQERGEDPLLNQRGYPLPILIENSHIKVSAGEPYELRVPNDANPSTAPRIRPGNKSSGYLREVLLPQTRESAAIY